MLWLLGFGGRLVVGKLMNFRLVGDVTYVDAGKTCCFSISPFISLNSYIFLLETLFHCTDFTVR